MLEGEQIAHLYVSQAKEKPFSLVVDASKSQSQHLWTMD
jgi:hypothetical protein